jgi:hypothetical protein
MVFFGSSLPEHVVYFLRYLSKPSAALCLS